MKSGYVKKPSNFSVLHKESKHSEGTYLEERETVVASECRICLEAGNGDPMVRPCRCTGTVEFTHEKCLREWIRTRAEKGEERVACELCQTEYSYEQGEAKRFKCSQLLASWQSGGGEMRCYLLLLLFALFLLAALIALVVYATTAEEGLRAKIMPSRIVMLAYIGAIVLSSLFLLFVASLFVSQYCVRTETLIRLRKYFPPRQRSVRRSRYSAVKV